MFEAWGSRGDNLAGKGKYGLGGYASGILNVPSKMTLYAFVGSYGQFNALKNPTARTFAYSGAATDVRLNVSSDYLWYDSISLRSRILVAGGGASAEWPGSIGGNGGGLIGSNGTIGCHDNGVACPEYYVTGGSQTSGGIASKNINLKNERIVDGLTGSFGQSIVVNNDDMGGVGGSGYWSGASIPYAGAGGGGSSFISGHKGCIALASEKSNEPSPTSSSVHYSGIYFTNTKMYEGNTNMPLYHSLDSFGIGNSGRGVLRITLVNDNLISCRINHYVNFLSECIYPLLDIIVSY